MKRFWLALAVTCAVAAAVSFWWQHYDAGFVIATVGALAWFLNYRVSAKQVIKAANQRDDQEGNEIEE